MKKFTTAFAGLALLFFYLFSFQTHAQSLPYEMRFSTDGKRLITANFASEGIFDESVVQVFELWFEQSNYWVLLTNNYQNSTDLPATLIVNGDTLESKVGVRFRGQTSYQMTQNSQKKSFNITIDYEDEKQDVDGYNTFNLMNCFEDPSFMREVLYEHQIRKHVPAVKANYVHLFINGQNWGVYPNVQQLDGNFFKEWFLSNDGTVWRALKSNPFGGGPGGGGTGGPFGTGYCTLNWLDTNDSTEYKKFYTLKDSQKSNPWEDLIEVIDELNNTPLAQLEDSIKYIFDIDRALWFLACEIIFGDDDSYVNKGGMDYYLYWEPETGRLVPQEYDANSVMWLEHVNWSPFFHETDPRYVLMNRLFAVPSLRQRYLAHLRTIIGESLQQDQMEDLIDGYANLIDSLVQADTKKLYSYDQFVFEQDELKVFVQGRRNFLQNHAAVNVQGLTIDSAAWSVDGVAFGQPDAGQEVQAVAQVSGSVGVSAVWLYYAGGLVGTFEKTQMFDDGNHEDGVAGDNLFGATIPSFGNGSYVRFYIEAIADNIQKTATYLPQGAEHDVFVYRVKVTSFIPTQVVINEIMASNTTTASDQDGEFDDWIELFNNSDTLVDLSGWSLTDNPDNLQKWSFPAGSTIDPKGYLIVWADENGSQAGLHASFKLSVSGEELYLVDPELNIGQEVLFGQQTEDMGYARIPNGTGDFTIKAPTFSFNNEQSTVASEVVATHWLTVFPNPASESVTVRTSKAGAQTLTICNALGQVFYRGDFFGETEIEVNSWSSGIYFLQSGNKVARFAVE